ncbi:MAG: homoserine kinase, partial [Rhodothermales bacterium]|nr:homoserine kinase [Rhodothermales bacterium]
IPVPIHFAVVRPEVRVLTREARAILPQSVPLRDAVHNASSLAFLVDALRAGDLMELGRAIEQDRIVEPVRATLVPCYDAVLGAAREAGSLGAALSGSGPAMFAVAESADAAEAVCEAMTAAALAAGYHVTGLACGIDPIGARTTELKAPEALY